MSVWFAEHAATLKGIQLFTTLKTLQECLFILHLPLILAIKLEINQDMQK